jgi:pimeloyl-ACP methyl ester carboxylesterase
LQKCAIIGLSVGGMWAAHLALMHPEAVTALVLMDTYVGSEPEATKTVYLNLLNEMSANPKIDPQFYIPEPKNELSIFCGFFSSLLLTFSSNFWVFVPDSQFNRFIQSHPDEIVFVSIGDFPFSMFF